MSLRHQNDISTSFRRHNDIIVVCVWWVYKFSIQILKELTIIRGLGNDLSMNQWQVISSVMKIIYLVVFDFDLFFRILPVMAWSR